MSTFPRIRQLALVAALALLGTACGTAETPEVSPSPRSEITADPIDEPAPGPSATPEPEDSPTPEPSPTEGEGETAETDAAAARFIAEYRPDGAADLEHVAIDLDGDDTDEIVFAYVRTSEGVSHLDVAWYDGEEYAVAWGADGSRAARIDDLRIADLNADGTIEVALSQSSGAASTSLWRATTGQRLAPVIADGGCADGGNAYGVLGATIADRDGDGRAEIYATCDDSPLPASAWSTDVYVWDGSTYAYDSTEVAS